jgi:hypothetical protein
VRISDPKIFDVDEAERQFTIWAHAGWKVQSITPILIDGTTTRLIVIFVQH